MRSRSYRGSTSDGQGWPIILAPWCDEAPANVQIYSAFPFRYHPRMEDVADIIEKITERYESPIRVGSRCEANTFYRVEYLSPEDIDALTVRIGDRIEK